MAEPTLTQFVVPAAPAGKKSPVRVALLALVLVFLLLSIYFMWRSRDSSPKCDEYSGDAKGVCGIASQACQDDRHCLNAVAQCMPAVVTMAKSAGGGPGWAATPEGISSALKPSEMRRCFRAVKRIDPAFAARLIMKGGKAQACLPAAMAAALKDQGTFDVTHGAIEAVSSLLPYAHRVASYLPACPGSGPRSREAAGS